MAAPSAAADQLDALRPLAEKGKANVAERKKLFKTANSDDDHYLSLEEATGVVKSTWPALANVHCIQRLAASQQLEKGSWSSSA